jgi:hypothetical protein
MFATLEEEIQALRNELQLLKGHKPATAIDGEITVGNYLLERLAQLGVKVRSYFVVHHH